MKSDTWNHRCLESNKAASCGFYLKPEQLFLRCNFNAGRAAQTCPLFTFCRACLFVCRTQARLMWGSIGSLLQDLRWMTTEDYRIPPGYNGTHCVYTTVQTSGLLPLFSVYYKDIKILCDGCANTSEITCLMSQHNVQYFPLGLTAMCTIHSSFQAFWYFLLLSFRFRLLICRHLESVFFN